MESGILKGYFNASLFKCFQRSNWQTGSNPDSSFCHMANST
jgi:hypothetical protein